MEKVKVIITLLIINFVLLVDNSFTLIAGNAPIVPSAKPVPIPIAKVPQKEKAAAQKKEAAEKAKVSLKEKAAKETNEAKVKNEAATEVKKVAAKKKEVAAKKEKAAVEKKVLEQPESTSKKAQPVEKQISAISDIDTVDIEEGGNWLLKRKALEDTVDVIEQINGVFNKLLEASTTFKIQRNKIDSEFDAFLSIIGLDLGDADQLLTDLLDALEKERKNLGDLTADERAAIVSINEKKNDIKQLQADLKALISLDDEIDKVLMTVDNQIKTANNYQGEAWKNFQAIKKVLSDEKAEDLYYRTEGLFKSMQDIYAYLTGILTDYFNSQMQMMRNQMNKVKSIMQSLQQKGIDLKQQVDKFEQEDEERQKEMHLQEQEEALKKALEEAKRKETTWTQSIMHMISYPFEQVKLLWHYLYSTISEWFSVSPKKAQVAEQLAKSEKISAETQQLVESAQKTDTIPAKK
jgi:hypothetical protein